MEQFKGKAIYNPSGKAGEYSRWACNFYTGCSNGCEYCYCKKGILRHAMGGDIPTLKKCFRNGHHAITTFFDELYDPLTEQPKTDIQEHGIFFSFTTDPCLPTTQVLHFAVIESCLLLNVPVQILTKCTAWIDTEQGQQLLANNNAPQFLAVGFTLTGHDELESYAAPNAERIEAMKRLHEMGIKTWASIEPMIDTEASYAMIEQTAAFCDHYKIGILKGAKYDSLDLCDFAGAVLRRFKQPIYFKDTFCSAAKIYRNDLSCNYSHCIEADYNIFR